MDTHNNTKTNVSEDFNLESQRETFVASISHDLKNPTIAQIRAIELILKGTFGEIQPQQREVMEMILDSCKYMNAMLCSLLTTYRCEKGSIKLSNNELSISELTEECCDEMKYLAKDKDVKIIYKNYAENFNVFGDRVQLKRVIMNLLSNGIKYAYKNSDIQVNVYNEPGYTCFCFKNSSPYLSPEKQDKIFARYVTFAQANKVLGIGLGLYASKKIVEAHDGEIFVKSFPDNKNIFGFKIPNDCSYCSKVRIVTF